MENPQEDYLRPEFVRCLHSVDSDGLTTSERVERDGMAREAARRNGFIDDTGRSLALLTRWEAVGVVIAACAAMAGGTVLIWGVLMLAGLAS
jgi:hypothetical protein